VGEAFSVFGEAGMDWEVVEGAGTTVGVCGADVMFATGFA
jgi:hypothetical protein